MGNSLADAIAKKVALMSLDSSSTIACVSETSPIPASLDHLVNAQQAAPASEHHVWNNSSCATDLAGVWHHTNGRPVCPHSILLYLVHLQHGKPMLARRECLLLSTKNGLLRSMSFGMTNLFYLCHLPTIQYWSLCPYSTWLPPSTLESFRSYPDGFYPNA